MIPLVMYRGLINKMKGKVQGAQYVVIDVFLWCLAAIYLFAFTSLYVQIPGLYGKDGILPARNVIHDLTACVDSDKRCPMWESWGECKANRHWMINHCRKSCNNCPESHIKTFFEEFNLLLLTPNVGLDTETGMEFLCLTGIIISIFLLLSARMRNCFSFLSLFLLYYSQHKVGQIFLWYQWDSLLLETGFLAILIAPWNISLNLKTKSCCFIQIRSSESSLNGSVRFWLAKWLLFRLMFSSGVVKLTYLDKTWWQLTALNWHYESQCIPSPLAWYFHHLPEWFQKLSVVMTYVIEIAVPFLFFFPLRCLRLFAFFVQIFLQILIFITGNYNFFNLLTIILCLSLVDDNFFGMKSSEGSHEKLCPAATSPSSNEASCEPATDGETSPLLEEDDDGTTKGKLKQDRDTTKYTKLRNTFNFLKDILASKAWQRTKSLFKVLTILIAVVLFTVFTVKWFSLKITSIKPKIAFTVDEFFSAVRNATYLSMFIGLFSLVVEICKALRRCLYLESTKERCYEIFKLLLVSITCLFMFGLSLVLYTGEIDINVQKNIPRFLVAWHDQTYHLEMVHSYGLFRSMTGVGGRPEVIIKGGDTPIGPWKEYDFLYKPGDLNKRPPFVAPHQPRLDWQMWFASLGNYDGNPWFLSLLHKLLLGKTDVLGLLDHGPFEETSPQFIKVELYRYHFTKNETSFWNALTHSSDQSWWSREYVSDYTPFIINKNASTSFESLLQSHFKLLRTDVPDETGSGLLYSVIHNLRSSRQGRLGPRLILVLFSSSLVLLATKLWWRSKGHECCSPLITQFNMKLKEPLNTQMKNISRTLNPLRQHMSNYYQRIRHWCIRVKTKNLRKLNKTYLKWRRVKSCVSHVKSWSNVECLKKIT